MSESIVIPGGCKLKTGTTVLGTSTDEPSIEIEEYILKRDYHTSESGPELPAYIIHLGRYCILSVPLIRFDKTQLDTLKIPSGTSTAGQIGTLGASVTLFSLSVVPNTTGQTAYTFAKSEYIDTIKIGPFGVTPQMYVARFRCLPDPTALGTTSTAYYTTSTT